VDAVCDHSDHDNLIQTYFYATSFIQTVLSNKILSHGEVQRVFISSNNTAYTQIKLIQIQSVAYVTYSCTLAVFFSRSKRYTLRYVTFACSSSHIDWQEYYVFSFLATSRGQEP
jgi:hypothetical protein